jgi:hypothetical protein
MNSHLAWPGLDLDQLRAVCQHCNYESAIRGSEGRHTNNRDAAGIAVVQRGARWSSREAVEIVRRLVVVDLSH